MTRFRRNRMLVFATLTLIALTASLALASCGPGSSGTTATTPAATTVPPAVSTTPAATTSTPAASVPPSSQSVAIANFDFNPADITVPKGTTVQWTNNDSAPHTVVADGGLFTSGNLSSGQSFSFKFDQAGTYAYHCSIHASMKGSVTVN